MTYRTACSTPFKENLNSFSVLNQVEERKYSELSQDRRESIRQLSNEHDSIRIARKYYIGAGKGIVLMMYTHLFVGIFEADFNVLRELVFAANVQRRDVLDIAQCQRLRLSTN